MKRPIRQFSLKISTMISFITQLLVLNVAFAKRLLFVIYSFLTSGNFVRLPIIFASSLDPDQDQQNIGPDLDTNHLTL